MTYSMNWRPAKKNESHRCPFIAPSLSWCKAAAPTPFAALTPLSPAPMPAVAPTQHDGDRRLFFICTGCRQVKEINAHKSYQSLQSLAKDFAMEAHGLEVVGLCRRCHRKNAESASLIKADGVCYSAGKRRIIDNISMSIEARRIVTIIGPNGSGKTTLIKRCWGLPARNTARFAVKNL